MAGFEIPRRRGHGTKRASHEAKPGTESPSGVIHKGRPAGMPMFLRVGDSAGEGRAADPAALEAMVDHACAEPAEPVAPEPLGMRWGWFAPGTPRGDFTIAHELAHVVQQSGGSDRAQASGLTTDGYEREADAAAAALAEGRPAPPLTPLPHGSGSVQRQPASAESPPEPEIDFQFDLAKSPTWFVPFADGFDQMRTSPRTEIIWDLLLELWDTTLDLEGPAPEFDNTAADLLFARLRTYLEHLGAFFVQAKDRQGQSNAQDVIEALTDPATGHYRFRSATTRDEAMPAFTEAFEWSVALNTDLLAVDDGLVDAPLLDAGGPFLEGLAAGLLEAEPAKVEALTKRLMVHSLFHMFFATPFVVGTAAGIVENVTQTFTDIANLLSDPVNGLRTMADGFNNLIAELSGPDAAAAAHELGRSLAIATTDRWFKLLDAKSMTGFSYELGKLVGPIIVETILALVGFEALVIGKVLDWGSDALRLLRSLKSMDSLDEVFRAAKAAPDAPDGPSMRRRKIGSGEDIEIERAADGRLIKVQTKVRLRGVEHELKVSVLPDGSRVVLLCSDPCGELLIEIMVALDEVPTEYHDDLWDLQKLVVKLRDKGLPDDEVAVETKKLAAQLEEIRTRPSELEVYDVPTTLTRPPDQILAELKGIPWGFCVETGCEAVAARVHRAIGGTRHTIDPPPGSMTLGPRNGVDTFWTSHEVVVRDGIVYDALTGPAGQTIADFKASFEFANVIPFDF